MRTVLFLIFVAVFAGALHFWQLSPMVAALYAAASIVCFAMYAKDKAASKAGRWRTSENTLLLLGLACGWPGAMLAQTMLRHKGNKASFKSRFWLTVVLNIAVFAYLASPVSPLRN